VINELVYEPETFLDNFEKFSCFKRVFGFTVLWNTIGYNEWMDYIQKVLSRNTEERVVHLIVRVRISNGIGRIELDSGSGGDLSHKSTPCVAIEVYNPSIIHQRTILFPLIPCFLKQPDGKSYTVYQHHLEMPDGDSQSYIGITRQCGGMWGARYRQHLASSHAGSPYRFHRALSVGRVLTHDIIGVNLSHESAMDHEENQVEKWSLYPKGLNMIPGGFAGLRWLAKHGCKKRSPKDWENRASIIRDMIKTSSLEGRPNPLVAAMWRNDDFAANIITKNPNNFNMDNVNEVRFLDSLGKSAEEIALHLNCHPRRVEMLVSGKTYSRVH
jgi:hypothetical protein